MKILFYFLTIALSSSWAFADCDEYAPHPVRSEKKYGEVIDLIAKENYEGLRRYVMTTNPEPRGREGKSIYQTFCPASGNRIIIGLITTQDVATVSMKVKNKNPKSSITATKIDTTIGTKDNYSLTLVQIDGNFEAVKPLYKDLTLELQNELNLRENSTLSLYEADYYNMIRIMHHKSGKLAVNFKALVKSLSDVR